MTLTPAARTWALNQQHLNEHATTTLQRATLGAIAWLLEHDPRPGPGSGQTGGRTSGPNTTGGPTAAAALAHLHTDGNPCPECATTTAWNTVWTELAAIHDAARRLDRALNRALPGHIPDVCRSCWQPAEGRMVNQQHQRCYARQKRVG